SEWIMKNEDAKKKHEPRDLRITGARRPLLIGRARRPGAPHLPKNRPLPVSSVDSPARPDGAPYLRMALTDRWNLAFVLFVMWSPLLHSPSAAIAAEEGVAATNRIDATTQQRRGRFGGPERGVYKSQINPHWFRNNTRFWYRNDLRDGKEFIV